MADLIPLTLSGMEHVALYMQVNPRARRFRIRVDAARRRLVAVTPHARRAAELQRFVTGQRDFVLTHWKRLGAAQPFCHGAQLDIYGDPITIIADDTAKRTRWVGSALIVPASHGDPDQAVERALRQRARGVFEEVCAYYARRLGKPIARLRVGDAGTRWGSCTSQGVITLSWRLILAPPDVADYVCAHEVAHLEHPNHSAAFWACTRQLMEADPAPHRAWLRNHGHTLFAWGARA
jgi:hypothetical protein